jgi:cyclopropane fatty-acyl-phospholipid synthase-like methyltransferase
LRQVFDEAAELYERARPTYPSELFRDLIELADLRGNGRILEIGAGTGKATRRLAERGFGITALELGAGLADVARGKLADFTNVRVVTADFEAWEPVEAGFDSIVSFSAFHWIDPSSATGDQRHSCVREASWP